jgi:hypothetical protein
LTMRRHKMKGDSFHQCPLVRPLDSENSKNQAFSTGSLRNNKLKTNGVIP